MAVATLNKQPNEIRLFAFNFANAMEASATLTGIDSIAIELVSGGGVASLTHSSEVAAGQKVQMLFDGGANGQTYKVTVRVSDSDDQLLELEGRMKIKEL
jgi:hypothetical protein